MQLDAIWLNAAADPSDRMSFVFVGDGYTVTARRGGGVEGGYASGRRRGWSTNEESVTVSGLTFHHTTADQREWLNSHIAVDVCLRDHMGNKVFGRYQQAPFAVSTLPFGHAAADNAIEVPFESVTWNEEV